jgi:serine protease
MTRGASHQRPRRVPAPRHRPRSSISSAHRRLRLESLEDRCLLTAVSFGLDETYTPTALLVQFKPESQFAGSLRAYVAGSVLGTSWEIAPGMREVEIAPGADLEDALAAFASDPNVLFAEPDYRVRLNMTPDDPNFASDQWHLNNTGQIDENALADINAPEAWEVETGNPLVVVAVIDTGVDYLHPDLAANMWHNEGEEANNGIDDDGNGFVDDVYGYDFANRDHDPMDDHLHGTHIAGTIAAVANNGVGVSGVAPGVKIMALKFMNASGSGLTSDAIAALNYAVANGASISNNSFGGGPVSQAFRTAISNAMGGSHIFVAAAGNYGDNNDTDPFYPGGYDLDNIITVAATDAADHLAWFSNYGKKSVDVGAPGVDIFSTFPSRITGEMLDRGITDAYGILSGTSMAAPVVAGVAALIRSQNDGLSAKEVIDQIMATVDRSPALLSKTVSGGRVNAAAALGGASVDAILPSIVFSDPSGTVGGPVSQVRLTFSEPIDATSFDVSDAIGMNSPLGPVTILSVEPVSLDGRKFAVTFEPLTEPGEYSLLISSHIQDLAGNELDQDGDGVGGVDGSDEYIAYFNVATPESSIYSSVDVPLELSGFDAITSYLTIPDDMPIADLNVQINMTFPQVGDLHVWLVSPNETVINLSYRHGGEGEGFSDTVFDDEADVSILDGAVPFTGSFQPDDPLSTLDVENALGTWQLVIQNVSETDHFGTLNSWSLEIVRRESGGGETGENDPPVAIDDTLNGFQNTPILIAPEELLENDSDPNDDPLALTDFRNPVGGTVGFDEEGMILFVPDSGNLGLASFEYIISDGVHTAIGTVVINLRPRFSLHNGYDVNNDGQVTAYDALLIINYLNAFGPGPIIGLGAQEAQKLYYDVVADNNVTPHDSLAVINILNAHGPGPVGAITSMATAAHGERLDGTAVDGMLASDEEKWF